MSGVNATIFAYGQTGSGKTFTITGGAERYVDRGIIPRSISFIFQEIARRKDQSISVSVSYLEIYQDYGYDLLDPEREVKQIEDLPRVNLWEDSEGKFQVRNLGMHHAANEEDALNLLFLGDTNRTISETPMNLTSSRSHCIFTVNMEVRTPGEDTVMRSKLNLVDLAGSERVTKTNIDGTTLSEAKYINSSLHFLEQVIIALQERAMGIRRTHIPYRNSMMTTVLKDSLGGNCVTSMIATVNTSEQQLDESISTCRFAQRVAMISNVVMVNEELDPKLVISRLKQEIRDLKEEVRYLKAGGGGGGPPEPGGEGDEEVGGQMLGHIKQQIQQYISDTSASARLNVGGSMAYIRTAFQIFKTFVTSEKETTDTAKGTDFRKLEDQVKKMKLQIQQRDNEISILVSMMKKRTDMAGLANDHAQSPKPIQAPSKDATPGRTPESAAKVGKGKGVATGPGFGEGGGGGDGMEDILANANLLADRNKAFEIFRKSYRKSEAIEDNKLVLKDKFQEAKALGQIVTESKKRIAAFKALIEKRRVERAVQGIGAAPPDGEVGEAEGEGGADPEEQRIKGDIDREKGKYKKGFERLRELKREIEHVQRILEKSRKKLQTDFEQWLSVMVRQQQQHQHASPGGAARGAAGVVGARLSPAAGRKAAVASAATRLDFDFDVDPAVLEKAKPLLTGNPEADRDILKFYQARHKLVNA